MALAAGGVKPLEQMNLAGAIDVYGVLGFNTQFQDCVLAYRWPMQG
jgi:hypothetical protein